ncbi:MAG: hypothetical protein JW991_00735 [Candidatus Pacebacteria bacterium]|nr:hypothetical protein [Candidatus Paceibacterota bacterium]
MAKKRKTRQEKIILQLKRQLAHQKSQKHSGDGIQPSQAKKLKTSSTQPRQGAIFKPDLKTDLRKKSIKRPDKSIFSYSPRLIRLDLIKSLSLALAIITLEIVLYLRLR